MIFFPVTSTSDYTTVTATVAGVGGSMTTNEAYLFASSTNCFIKQGSCKLVTFVSKANHADTDYFTITLSGTAVIYEMDTAGNGVTSGRVQVNISTDTTAANVAARARTAILANQPTLEVTDNTDGTLTICAPNKVMTITENVANAGFLVANAAVTASAADGSMYVPANYTVVVDGGLGPQLGVIRDTADGKASLVRAKSY